MRLSGPAAEDLLARLFHRPGSGDWQTHHLYYGTIEHEGQVLDRCLAVLMRSPHSYTGEAVAEFHTHGGAAVPGLVLQACLALGARLARPGEFTLRAFLNGKLDLAQAEAVQQLIQSRSSAAARLATQNLTGALSAQVATIRASLLDWMARLEAEIDFGDEVPGFSPEESRRCLESARGAVERLLASAQAGQILADGIKTVLIGPPNAGKSTLLNALLGQQRALVTPIAGTTRDTIEETTVVGGLVLQLVDTAGIRRDPGDLVEELGVERSRSQARAAELLILVLDASQPLPDEPDLYEVCRQRRTLVLLNKADLPARLDADLLVKWLPEGRQVSVCLLQPEGVERAFAAVAEEARQVSGDRSEVFSLTRRQLEALQRCHDSLSLLGSSLEAEASAEFLCLDLRHAVQALGELQGIDVTEEILDRIFSTFCLGK